VTDSATYVVSLKNYISGDKFQMERPVQNTSFIDSTAERDEAISGISDNTRSSVSKKKKRRRGCSTKNRFRKLHRLNHALVACEKTNDLKEEYVMNGLTVSQQNEELDVDSRNVFTDPYPTDVANAFVKV